MIGSGNADGGEVYAKYVADQLALQDSYKASLKQRAMAVISSSSTLAALLFAFMALVTRAANFRLPLATSLFLIAAIALFAAAALSAILVNRPRDYAGVQVDPVKEAVEKWTDDRRTAQQRVALTQLEVLRASKKQNADKGEWLLRAVAGEAFAVAALAFAVGSALALQ